MSIVPLADQRDPNRIGTVSASPTIPNWLDLADARALVALLLATAAFFWPMIRPFGSRLSVVAGDFSNQFFPFRAFAGEEWWSRRIPLWNPFVYGGHPFQADVQTAVFYPPALLNAIAWGRHGAFPFFALEGEIVVHTFLASAFMYLLARKVTGSVVGSLVAGLAFGFGGFVTSYPAQQLAILETIAWLPLIVLCLELALESPVSWRWLISGSLAFGVAILAGHPQTDLFIGYATVGYLAARLWWAQARLKSAIFVLVVFPALSLAVAAIQIIPTMQFFSESVRARMDFATAAHGYLLSALWEVFVPLWHGEKALSIGVVALVFAVIGAIASRRESLVYWAVVGLVAVTLSTGGETPLFGLLYYVAPGWNLFRDQERVICIFAFAAALLAARGVAAVEAAVQGTSTRKLGIALSLTGAILSLAFFGTAILSGWSADLRASLGLDLAVLAVLSLILMATVRIGPRTVPIGIALVLLVGAENFAINQGNNLSVASPDPRPRLAATAQFMRGFPEPFRVKALNETLFPSNFGTLLGTPMITGDTPFTTRRADEMLSGNPDYKVWQLLNLKFFVTNGGPLGGLRPVFHEGALTTYYLEDSLPRAWAVTSLEVARDAAEARAMILAPTYHPGNIVVLERAPGVGSISVGPRPDVRITGLDPQRYSIDTDAAQNAMLVVAEQYYPDWQAFRDGAPVPVYRANYLTMAFDLPAGRHHFEIVYRPTPFYVGAGLSLATIALIGLGLWRGRLKLRLGIAGPTWQLRIRPMVWIYSSSLLILAGAFALRIHALDAPNLTGDEWFMLRNHDEGVAWIVHQAHTFEPHPLVYYIGLAGWIELAGRSEFALRFPSVVGGVVLVAALIGLGRTLVCDRAGVIAGALAALNPYQLAESQNARNYELVAAMSAVASLLFLRALRHGRRRDWAGYGVAMLVALNVHYDAALVLAAHVLYFLALRSGTAVLTSRRAASPRATIKSPTGSWLLTTGVVTLAFAAWLAYAWPALAAYHGYFPTPVGIDHVLSRSLATFTLGSQATVGQAVPAFVLAVVSGAWLAFSRPGAALYLGLYVLLPIAAVSLLFLLRPMYDERYLIVLAPGYLVLLASGIDGLIRRIWPLGVLVGVVAVVTTWPLVQQTYATALTDRGDYRAMARWVSTMGAADDPIVATGHGQAELFGYYLKDGRTVNIVDDPAKIGSLGMNLGAHGGLWLLPSFQSEVDAAFMSALEQRGVPVAERWFVNVRALYYASDGRLQPSTIPRTVWDNTLRLEQVTLSSSEIRPGEAIAAEFRWTATASMATPKLSLRLLGAANSLVEQSDLAMATGDRIASGPVTTRIGLFVPPATPPGRYSLVVVPYYPDSGKALVAGPDGLRKDGTLDLGLVVVGQRDRPFEAQEAGVPLISPVAFPTGVTFLGHDDFPSVPTPGISVVVRFLWRADRAALTDLVRTVELRSTGGAVIATQADPILPSFPTSMWNRGEILVERASLKLPATLDTGKYTLSLKVGGDGASVDLGTISVTGPDRTFVEPTGGEKVGVAFGRFALLDREIRGPSPAGPGTTSNLTIVWRALATSDHPYTVFVHVLDPSGKIVAQVDRQPVDGQRPTDGWVPGEYVADSFDVKLPSDATPGPYQIEVGFYDAATGVRVPARLANGSVSDHVVFSWTGNAG